MKARYSITGRITGWFFISCSALLISGSTLLYLSLVGVLRREDINILNERVQTLQSILHRTNNALDAARRRIESEWSRVSPEKVYVRLKDDSGKLVSISPGTPREMISGIFEKHPLSPTRWRAPSGEDYLARSSRMRLGNSGSPESELTADVAIDLSSEDAVLSRFRARLLVILLTGIAVAFAFGRKLAQVSLDPVQRIAARASGIGPTNLHERIGTEDQPEELRLLVFTFNEMLDRLSDSFTRLSRFSSDIAHELRTPINNMRGEIEIALNKTRSVGEYEEVLASSLEEIDRLAQIINALLFLAKSEHPQTQLDLQTCDLKAELSRIAEFYETISAEAGVNLAVDAPESALLRVNRTLFSTAIANLVTNAIAHTPSGGHVTLRGRQVPGMTDVEVIDTGEGIASEHLPRVFDRFYRVDPSRSKGSQAGFGLGLAIVQAIVHLHSGNVEIQSAPGHGTRVKLLFPERPDPSPQMTEM